MAGVVSLLPLPMLFGTTLVRSRNILPLDGGGSGWG
jgi:hypothetical protein